jgi:hypothetical protein
MPDLVWDEATTRYYETGVSKGILFPMGETGVPWNGLVAVSLDPSGGEPEHYYFEGVKYMDRVLAEDFQATIQAINTPREFEPMEGIKDVKFGMKTHFNKRDKFNMAWRTEIGNDEGQSIAYKLHIAYNCLVQPAAKSYRTISDSTSMDLRSFVITTTPACGRHSYYSFDSRDGDLSLLEAQLFAGNLPSCAALSSLVGAPSGPGGGGSVDPDAGCSYMLEDLESYTPGLSDFSDTKFVTEDPLVLRTEVGGAINNGLDIIELPAVGAFAANDSAASEVGTGDILADDDDATYITSADGDLGYTVGLPPLVGYSPGCAFELHIRASITGGVNPDDPENLDADMQVHIATDDTGDVTVGGFSNGADEGMGFSLIDVDGTPVDYVVPLAMDAWVDTDIDDVVAALEAGAYLNFVGATNNNPETTPATVRVYEAKIVVLDDSEKGLFLRPMTADGGPSVIRQTIFADDTLTVLLTASYTMSVDFRVIEVPWHETSTLDPQGTWVLDPSSTSPGAVVIDVEDGILLVKWRKVDGSAWFTAPLDTHVWYAADYKWGWDQSHLKVYERDNPTVVLIDQTIDFPTAEADVEYHTVDGFRSAWSVGDDSKAYEVAIDNAEIQVHCSEETPLYPFTVDLPAWNATGGSPAVTDSDALSTTDTGSEIVLGSNIGVGYFAETDQGATVSGHWVYMPATPDGYTLTRATYVAIAYREADSGTYTGSPWDDYIPGTGLSNPLLEADSEATIPTYAITPLPVGGYSGEIEWSGDEILSYLTNPPGSQKPANRLNWNWTTTYVPTNEIHLAYYAIRLYYDPI